jgi:hypothetical protein
MGIEWFKDHAIGFGIGFSAWAVFGGTIALLYAPGSGKETRQLIKDKASEVTYTAREKTGEVIETFKDACLWGKPEETCGSPGFKKLKRGGFFVSLLNWIQGKVKIWTRLAGFLESIGGLLSLWSAWLYLSGLSGIWSA